MDVFFQMGFGDLKLAKVRTKKTRVGKGIITGMCTGYFVHPLDAAPQDATWL